MNDNRRPGTAGYHPLRKVRIALQGIWYAVFRDFTVRYKLIVSAVFLTIAGIYETPFHFLFMLAVTGLMLATEILNSAIEAVCDYIQPEYDDRIKHIKDMAAGATFIAIFIWYIVIGVVAYELVAGKEVLDSAPAR